MTADDLIRAAGAQLAQQWAKHGPGAISAPENDLNPDASKLQFRVKLLEDRISGLENTIRELKRHVGIS